MADAVPEGAAPVSVTIGRRRNVAALLLVLGWLAAVTDFQLPSFAWVGVEVALGHITGGVPASQAAASMSAREVAFGGTRRAWPAAAEVVDGKLPRSKLQAVMQPPTQNAPPAISDDVAVFKGEWAECLVQYADSTADAQEVWVFRKRDYTEFQRLIGLRLSYQSTVTEKSRFGADRRQQAMSGTTVSCRDRSIDPELVCAECIRVFTGGAYKDKAISVPAFPSQPTVLGCLALSVRMETGVVNEDPTWPLMQTAFCNTVNARFTMVDE